MISTDKNNAGLLKCGNLLRMIETLRASGARFRCELSTYNASIYVEGSKQKFMRGLQPLEVFIAYNKIKADIKKSGKQMPIVNEDSLKYYDSNDRFPTGVNTIYNIDLKSAYATILLNNSFITRNTYTYLSTLPKQSRLACVGMLAKKKVEVQYFKGKILSSTESRSELAPYFFFCVQETQRIMEELRQLIGEDAYLFTWADGIYFKKLSPAKIERIKKFFRKENFLTTFETLKNFVCKSNDYTHTITFLKEGKEKIFHLPISDELGELFVTNIFNTKHKNGKPRGKNAASKIKATYQPRG